MEKIKRIVFLDIDGVLNHDFSKLETIYNFEKEAIETLNLLNKYYPYSIVISSSWKDAYTLMFLQKLFKNNGIDAEVIDKTNSFFSKDERIRIALSLDDLKSIETDIRYSRDYEIYEWIHRMKPENFIIIDDFHFYLKENKEHHLLTCNWGNNEKEMGLKISHFEKLVELIKKPNNIS